MINSQDGWISVHELFETVVGIESTVTVETTVAIVGCKLITVGVVWVIALLIMVTGPRADTD